MSGYARAAQALGAEVTGSDGALSPYAERLRADGVLEVKIGHDAENVPEGAGVEVIYSSAVPAGNPEREAARERGLAERPRAELLGEFTERKRTIAVAGTHGKTTTASMLVHALRAAGAQPGWLVGAPVGGGLPNAEWGEGEWLVVEADESDRSMLSLNVEIGVLTNVELDHHASFALAGGVGSGVSHVSGACEKSDRGVGSPRAARADEGFLGSRSRWPRAAVCESRSAYGTGVREAGIESS